MANKYDLKTVVANVGVASGLTNIGTNIPAGKTRFLTYIRLERSVVGRASTLTGVTGMVVSVAESDLKVSELSAGTALVFGLAGVSAEAGSCCNVPDIGYVNSIPDRPDVNHPILSMVGAGSTWMTFATISAVGATASLFAQYYDE